MKIDTFVTSFDYSVFDAEKTKIKGITDFKDYIQELYNNDYAFSVTNINQDSYVLSESFIEFLSDYKIEMKNKKVCDGVYNNSDNVLFETSSENEVGIDDVNYSLNNDGINIVVYDNQKKRVIDSITFYGEDFGENTRIKKNLQ